MGGLQGWEAFLRQPVWKAIATDIHFWLPVVVLAVGIVLLAVMK